jgi:antitoxin CcdA
MECVYDTCAVKKPTNLSINSDLLAKAKALKINLSLTLENVLADLIRAQQRELWRQENQTAIKAYNQHVQDHGFFSNGLRTF